MQARESPTRRWRRGLAISITHNFVGLTVHRLVCGPLALQDKAVRDEGRWASKRNVGVSNSPWTMRRGWPARSPAASSKMRDWEQTILGGHFQATRERVHAMAGPVLVLHDTTEFSYMRGKPELVGLSGGSVRRNGQETTGKRCGVLMHS